MFVELAEIVKETKLTIMVEDVGGGNIFLFVHPKPVEGKNTALFVPLGFTGTPEELDKNLSELLVRYTTKRQDLAESLEAAEAVMDAAKKLAQEEATKKSRKATKKTAASGKTQAQEKQNTAGDEDETETEDDDLEDTESVKSEECAVSDSDSGDEENLFG